MPRVPNEDSSAWGVDATEFCRDPLSSTGLRRRSLIDNWRQSERRRMGLLATRAYESRTLACPTNIWSYQQTFIELHRPVIAEIDNGLRKFPIP